MKRSVYRGLVRLQSYVEPEVAERLDRFCASTGLSESALLKSSLCKYMDGLGDATQLFRRLDRLGRAQQRGQRDQQILMDAFSVFVRLWLAHTPAVPDASKRAAHQSGESRYREYLARVVQQFSGGPRFLDDLPRELLAEEAELSAAAESGKPAKGSG